MKKIFCVVLVLVLVWVLCYNLRCCKNNKNTPENSVETPYVQVHVVYDSNGNMLQQTLYNKSTEEYFLKEYTYVCNNRGFWICTDQTTTILKPKKEPNKQEQYSTINLFKVKDLQAGPIVLLDNAEAKISIVKYLTADSWWEFGYELKIENKMNTVITTIFDCFSIMGIQCKPIFFIDHIDANDTAYFTLAWDSDSLDRSHVPYVDNVEFMIRIYDDERWNTHALSGGQVIIQH